jgi:hypothetical protein
MSQSLILIGDLSSACLEKKEKKKREKWPEAFFPRAGHVLLAVLHGIFAAVRWNYR